MNKCFITVKATKDVVLNPEMCGRVGLVASAQYVHLLDALQKEIPHSLIGGQVLGCNATTALHIRDDVDCYLFLGEGRFHALRIAQETGKKVFVADGTCVDVEDFEKRKRGRQLKYLHAKKVGILQTLKCGQQFGSIACVRERVLAEGKKPYVFLDDTFDVASLENFNDIDIFVNCACPRLEGTKIIAFEELPR